METRTTTRQLRILLRDGDLEARSMALARLDLTREKHVLMLAEVIHDHGLCDANTREQAIGMAPLSLIDVLGTVSNRPDGKEDPRVKKAAGERVLQLCKEIRRTVVIPPKPSGEHAKAESLSL